MEEFNCSSGDVKDETLWRSIESDSDNPNDSVGTVFFDISDDDQLFFDATKSSIGPEGIIDAMRSLQLGSAKKLKLAKESNVASQEINLLPMGAKEEEEEISKVEEIFSQEAEKNFNDEKVEESSPEEKEKKSENEETILKEAEENVEDEKTLGEIEINSAGPESSPEEKEKNSKTEETIPKEEEKSPIKEEKIDEKKVADPGEKKGQGGVLKAEDLNLKLKNTKVPVVIRASMTKATKPLASKKSVAPVIPKLQTASRTRSAPRSLLKPPAAAATTMTNNNSSSIKRQSSNVSSVSASSDKSSASGKKNPTKLNNTVSSIVLTKDGPKLQEEKVNNFSIPIITNRKKRTEFIPFSFSTRNKINNKNEIINKENKSSNIITTKLPVIKKSMTTSVAPLKPKFDPKIKQKESETRALEAKKMKDIELKKKLITKPRAIPCFKAPLSTTASSRSTKVMAVSQKPAL